MAYDDKVRLRSQDPRIRTIQLLESHINQRAFDENEIPDLADIRVYQVKNRDFVVSIIPRYVGTYNLQGSMDAEDYDCMYDFVDKRNGFCI